MTLLENLNKIAAGIPAEIKQEKDKYVMQYLVAERKAFLSRKKLTYKAQFKIDEEKKELRFTEMLKESGFGLSSGGGDMGMSPGFGFKKEVYKSSFSEGREGSIEEQSNLFGKQYNYTFDYAAIRKQFEAAAKEAGYQFVYKVTGWGL